MYSTGFPRNPIYVPRILRLQAEIGGMFADNMDLLTLTRWRSTCKTNYEQAVASLRRSLMKSLNRYVPSPLVMLEIITQHRGVFGGEFALAFILRDPSLLHMHLDIFVSDYEFGPLCSAILKDPGIRNITTTHEYSDLTVLDALRTLVSSILTIETTRGTTIRVHRSYTSSATAPISRASCTAFSNFVTAYGFGCSHPILTFNHRALIADQELPQVPVNYHKLHDRLIARGFTLAFSPTAWPEFRCYVPPPPRRESSKAKCTDQPVVTNDAESTQPEASDTLPIHAPRPSVPIVGEPSSGAGVGAYTVSGLTALGDTFIASFSLTTQGGDYVAAGGAESYDHDSNGSTNTTVIPQTGNLADASADIPNDTNTNLVLTTGYTAALDSILSSDTSAVSSAEYGQHSITSALETTKFYEPSSVASAELTGLDVLERCFPDPLLDIEYTLAIDALLNSDACAPPTHIVEDVAHAQTDLLSSTDGSFCGGAVGLPAVNPLERIDLESSVPTQSSVAEGPDGFDSTWDTGSLVHDTGTNDASDITIGRGQYHFSGLDPLSYPRAPMSTGSTSAVNAQWSIDLGGFVYPDSAQHRVTNDPVDTWQSSIVHAVDSSGHDGLSRPDLDLAPCLDHPFDVPFEVASSAHAKFEIGTQHNFDALHNACSDSNSYHKQTLSVRPSASPSVDEVQDAIQPQFVFVGTGATASMSNVLRTRAYMTTPVADATTGLKQTSTNGNDDTVNETPGYPVRSEVPGTEPASATVGPNATDPAPSSALAASVDVDEQTDGDSSSHSEMDDDSEDFEHTDGAETEHDLPKAEECWRHRYVCPSQGRYFGDRGSFVDFFDPLRGGERYCAENNLAPFGPMVVWRVLSMFNCEEGCDMYDDVLEEGVTSIPVLIRRDPFGELRDVVSDRSMARFRRSRSVSP